MDAQEEVSILQPPPKQLARLRRAEGDKALEAAEERRKLEDARVARFKAAAARAEATRLALQRARQEQLDRRHRAQIQAAMKPNFASILDTNLSAGGGNWSMVANVNVNVNVTSAMTPSAPSFVIIRDDM